MKKYTGIRQAMEKHIASIIAKSQKQIETNKEYERQAMINKVAFGNNKAVNVERLFKSE